MDQKDAKAKQTTQGAKPKPPSSGAQQQPPIITNTGGATTPPAGSPLGDSQSQQGSTPQGVYPQDQTYQPMPGGYPPQGAYPPAGYPPQGAYPQQGGYPPAGQPYPGMPQGAYPPQGGYPPAGYPPQGAYPPQVYPQAGQAYPGMPQQGGYPPQGAYPPVGQYSAMPQGGFPPGGGGAAQDFGGFPPAGQAGGAPIVEDTTPANFQLGTKLPSKLNVPVPKHTLKFDEQYFIRLLAGSISLSKDEKKKIIESIPKLRQAQIDELIRIFEEEKQKFAALSKKHVPQLEKLAQQHYNEWMDLEGEYKLTHKKKEDQSRADEIRKNLGL